MFGLILWAAFAIVVWLVPVLIVVKLVNDDERDVGKWGCLALIFGWPVLIIYVVTQDEGGDRSSGIPAFAPRPMRRCPSCGEPIPALATVCRVCDTRVAPLAPGEVPSYSPRSTVAGPTRLCPFCRTPTPANQETCLNCGETSSI